MIVVRDREAGNVITPVNDRQEGEMLIKLYEADDYIEGCYEPDFYEVAEIEDEE